MCNPGAGDRSTRASVSGAGARARGLMVWAPERRQGGVMPRGWLSRTRPRAEFHGHVPGTRPFSKPPPVPRWRTRFSCVLPPLAEPRHRMGHLSHRRMRALQRQMDGDGRLRIWSWTPRQANPNGGSSFGGPAVPLPRPAAVVCRRAAPLERAPHGRCATLFGSASGSSQPCPLRHGERGGGDRSPSIRVVSSC